MFWTSRKKLRRPVGRGLGGRVPRKIVFDDITSGASNDLEQVTRMARAMVTRFGHRARSWVRGSYGQTGDTPIYFLRP